MGANCFVHLINDMMAMNPKLASKVPCTVYVNNLDTSVSDELLQKTMSSVGSSESLHHCAPSILGRIRACEF